MGSTPSSPTNIADSYRNVCRSFTLELLRGGNLIANYCRAYSSTVEQTAHNRLVLGSNPSAPTITKMKKFLWTIKNVAKIILWLFILIVSIHCYGAAYGSLYFTTFALSWNLVLSLFRTYRIFGKDSFKVLLRTIFSKRFYLIFIFYGCYCSPKFGFNWETTHLTPIDGLDEACMRHDISMWEADQLLSISKIDKVKHGQMKNTGDWKFMKEAMTLKHYANGIYLLGLEIGFALRIVGRTIKMYLVSVDR